MARAIILTVDDDPAVSQAITRDLRSRYGDRYRLARSTSGGEITFDSVPGETTAHVRIPVKR